MGARMRETCKICRDAFGGPADHAFDIFLAFEFGSHGSRAPRSISCSTRDWQRTRWARLPRRIISSYQSVAAPHNHQLSAAGLRKSQGSKQWQLRVAPPMLELAAM